MHNPILSAALITIGVAGLILWPRIERLLSPTAPEEPDTSDGQEERPASGADVEYADELHAMTQELAQHPGFIADKPEPDPEDIRYAALIEEFRSRLYVAEEHFARAYMRAVEAFEPDANQTGSFDRRELELMLAGAA
jgi:hypothetical protein